MTDEKVIAQPPLESDLKYSLSKFKLIKVLNNLTNRKSVFLLGQFPDVSLEDQAVIILEKKAFSEENVAGYFTEDYKLHVDLNNDIYSNLDYLPNVDLNSLKVTVIYPATEKHILKYSVQNIFIVQESPELHNSVVKPHIIGEQFTLDWVYNILEYKQEQERILFDDTCARNGFVLLPDLKWDGKTKETLYCLAIARQRDISSLRDLNETHLDLLKNIRDKGILAIKEKFQVDRSQLRIYLHYLPSFYHIHVHFTFLKHDAPGIYCERSHLLDGVINNIELMSNYYQKSTLSFTIRECDKLYEKIFKSAETETKNQDQSVSEN